MTILPEEWINIPQPVGKAFKSVSMYCDYLEALIQEVNKKVGRLEGKNLQTKREAFEFTRASVDPLKKQMERFTRSLDEKMKGLRQEIMIELKKKNEIGEKFA